MQTRAQQRAEGLHGSMAEAAAEGNHRGGSSGASWQTNSEINKIVVRKVQRCDREDLCGTISCENEI